VARCFAVSVGTFERSGIGCLFKENHFVSTESEFYFNGINGETGNYLLEPMTSKRLSEIIRGNRSDENLKELQWRNKRNKQRMLGPIEGVDPKDLAQAGWGVIFSFDDPNAEATKKELRPLLDHRREQARRRVERRYREFIGTSGYHSGESKNRFLARQGVGPGPADPDKVPYYLLIVGDPEQIPYWFQYQLDVQYAVGRIHFDTLEEYANYARSVVDTEKGGAKQSRKAVFFGVQNSDDDATKLSVNDLVKPLAASIAKDKPTWNVLPVLQENTTKQNLARLFGGADTPSFLFTASHGMAFPNGSKRQLPHQGALVCQEWPGPRVWANRPIPTDFYFSADDVGSEARLLGLITFHFACYAAGTPALNDFPQQEFQETRETIAPHAFVARLPQRLLSHPKGGALAVIGHVERAWGYSFSWQEAGRQLQVFEATSKRLMEGHPVGSAFEFFNQRYAELATDLKEELEFHRIKDDLELAGMWTACNDARGYAIIGDPAVRLVGSDNNDGATPPP
jgi:hypothetical protein